MRRALLTITGFRHGPDILTVDCIVCREILPPSLHVVGTMTDGGVRSDLDILVDIRTLFEIKRAMKELP
jgi:hypothetical protein